MAEGRDEIAEPVRPLLAGLDDGAVVLIAPEHRRIVNIHGVPLHRPRIGVRLRYRIEGKLTLRDGRIAGGDLRSGEYCRVFSRRADTGTYPVLTVYAEAASGRVAAFGVIRFANETAEICTPALFEGEDPSVVTDNMTGGLGTDSGTIALGEPEAEGYEATDEQIETLHQRIDRGLAGDSESLVVDHCGVGLCVWRCGFGDGAYTPYWGIGRCGKLCFLAADFNVVANGLYAPAVPWGSLGTSLDLQPKPRVQSWWHKLWQR